uniref:Tr-type G domain-containing protein n=1 Tax=Arcella intermedia TaxID=1963864 RepID=A0A6B2L376_9EUKA
MVIIGNVDAGKSTTTGHLITELGFIDDHVIRAYEEAARKIGKLSFKFAWVMDKLKNEREMGLTIEVGFWNIATSKFNVDILDSPGHRNFVKNMAAGASMADAAVLVVSAAPQEFEAGIMKGGMTREESIIAYSCGVRQFIVAVNKMDTVGYSEQRFKEVSTEIINILKKYGIAQEKIAAIPVSGYVGDNLICVSKVPELGWWQGWPMKTASGAVIEAKTLVEAIDLIIPPVRSTNIPLRMPIQKAFQLKGVGTLAIGRVATGTIKPGDHIKIDVLSTTSEKLTVGTIETNNTNRDEVGPGELVAVQVKGVSAKLLRRGMVISHLNAYPAARVVRFTAQMAIMQHPGELKVGYTPYFHCHTDSFPGKWVEIVHTIDKRTNGVKEKNPRCVKQGEMALVVIEPVIPVVLETFSEFPPLGRFVMRDAFTVGFGIIKAVEKQTVAPPKHPAGRGGRGVGRGRK